MKASDDEGYFYDIYYHKAPEDITEDDESDDGGQCTSDDIGEAIDMAKSQVDSYLLQMALISISGTLPQ